MDSQLQQEFDRLRERSPWLASFVIAGQVYGAGLNHDQDVRPPDFFRLVPDARRILELGSCQGGGTFQLARHPGVREVVAVEGRKDNLDKARAVQRALGVTNVTFLQADLEKYDVAALGRFDAVYCVGLLYHLPRPWELLAKLAAVTDVLYLNTHYCHPWQVDLAVNGYEGWRYRELGAADPLSGMSDWSFWPTLESLTKMLTDSGFLPEVLATDTMGTGQSPHGTTILARRTATLSAEQTRAGLRKMHRVLSSLPRADGGQGQPARVSWLRKALSTLKRATVGRVWKRRRQRTA